MEEPDPTLSPALQALWHAAKGEFDPAHAIVQAREGEADCDWVHAYLHRWEGDAGNAAYWYRRASRPMGHGDLTKEREAIRLALEK
jgi:hypothetical protein